LPSLITNPKNKKNAKLSQDEQARKKLREFEQKSEDFKRQYFKKCPSCKSWIQRSYGCNHMHCILCNTDFCYACGKVPRHHSQSQGFYCSELVEEAPWQSLYAPERLAFNVINELIDEPVIPCVRCKRKLQRHAKNNHMVCLVCKTEFCFVCKEILKGTKGHFSAVGCPQHGSR